MKNLVLSVGGSILCPEQFDVIYAKNLAQFAKSHSGKLILVTGGGKTARNYISTLKSEVKNKAHLDTVGIMATHINAAALSAVFHANGIKHEFHPNDWPEKMSSNILIAAGKDGGHSTDFDAVLLAEKYGIKELVNISNTKGIYDQDPNSHTNAKRYKTLTWEQLQQIVGDTFSAGMHAPFDPKATKRACENGTVSCWFVDSTITHLSKIAEDKPVEGTFVSPNT